MKKNVLLNDPFLFSVLFHWFAFPVRQPEVFFVTIGICRENSRIFSISIHSIFEPALIGLRGANREKVNENA